MNAIIIATGAAAATLSMFGKRGLAPSIAAGVLGWTYSEVTVLCLSLYLMLFLVREWRRPESERHRQDETVLDAEYEVIDGD